MKYNDIAKAALVLVLGVITSTAFAANLYEETFEGPAANSAITNLTGWTRGADDVSKIVVTNTYTGTKLLPDPHTKVLQLNTEGGVLTNNIADVSFSTATRYVDTLVKFVPSEDLPTFDAAGDIKVAVYAYVKEVQASPLITATNLAIYHGLYFDGDSYPTNTLTDLPIDPNSWYRLTIELASRQTAPGFQGFKIFINGAPVTSASAYTNSNWADIVQADEEPASGGKWFLSAANKGNVTVATIQFKGTGFIDDLAVTAEDPLEIAPSGFIVTQNLGANGTCTDTNLTITVTGVSTTLTYTAADFYEIATLTTNGTAVSGAAGSKSKTINIYGATSVTSSFAIVTGYGDSDNVAWFKSKGWTQAQVVSGLDYDKLQMLNCAPTNVLAGATIEITAIEIAGDDVKVTVAIDRTMSVGAINGNVCLYGWTVLGGTPTLVGAADVAGSVLGTNEDLTREFTFTGAAAGGKKFFKAVIEDPALRP